jgi:hypothetical protein
MTNVIKPMLLKAGHLVARGVKAQAIYNLTEKT